MISRLALGTAQFGSPYGIANRSGEIGTRDVAAILSAAQSAGIDLCDTAAAYGKSEACLGEAGVDGWKVVTKLPPLPPSVTDVAAWVADAAEQSLARLNQTTVWGVLLHRSDDLLGVRGAALYEALVSLRRRGSATKIGLSIYRPSQLDALWPRFDFDLVQAPLNIVDQRLVASGWLARLRAQGVEVHARSPFLQGLLLMPAAERPAGFRKWQPLFDRWQAWVEQHSAGALKMCLDFVMSHDGVSRVVVGVDSLAQLHDILEAARAPQTHPAGQFACDDVELIEPFRWGVP